MSTSATTENIAAMQSVMDHLDIHSTATSQCCPSCLTRLEQHLSTRGYYCCPECGEQSHGYDLMHKPLPEFALMEDEDITRSLTYYHWTTKKEWTKELPSCVMAHLGSKQAAWERMRDERRAMRWMEENPEGIVYIVKLKADASIHEGIFRDEEDPDGESEGTYSELYDGFVERYLNVIEAPGAISLCASKDDFTVVEKIDAREFFGDAAMELN